MHARAEDEAAVWALRHPLSPGEEHELEIWLSRDPRHAGLLLRAMAGVSVIDEAIAPALTYPSRDLAQPARRRVLMGAGAALAASIAGIAAWRQITGESVATRRGEIRRLPLADGSVATINTDSVLRVSFGAEDRRVDLARGQAWFQVAKDRHRPFVVDAGAALARAVGTAFSVERVDHEVRVSVTEGTVAVWARGARGAETILTAGEAATFASDDAIPSVVTAPAAIERSLAWRTGEIALENETLGAAVAQFNRYNRRQLVVADPTLAAERLVGLFQLDRPEDFASSLAASHDVAVNASPDKIMLARRKSGSD